MAITILGATGTTGEMIANLLKSRKSEIILVARNQERLEKLRSEMGGGISIRQIDLSTDTLSDRDALASALAGTTTLVNCVGPFSDKGLSVARAALDCGAHYLDISGEQAFIGGVIKHFSEPALESGVTFVPSCAFEYALSETAAHLLRLHLDGLDSFNATYHFKRIRTSRGTKKSVLHAMGSEAVHLVDGEMKPIEPGAFDRPPDSNDERDLRFPFPGGEVYMVPLHTPVSTVKTYLGSHLPPWAIRWAGKYGPRIASSALQPLILSFLDRTSQGPSQVQLSKTSFSIRGLGAFNKFAATATISGTNPYYLTALMACEVALSLDNNRHDSPRGVISPSMVGGPEFIKKITEQHGVSWQIQ